MTSPLDLTVLSDVKAWINITSTTDDALLGRLITAASVMIQSYLDCIIPSQSYSEVYSGNGGNRLVIRNTPITAVSSLVVGSTTYTAQPAYGQTGFLFDDDEVYLVGGCFAHGVKNVQITYTAGYEVIPFDIAQACIELVAVRYEERTRIGLVSQSMDGQTTAYTQKDMPDSVKTAINPYRRVFGP